MPMVIQSRPVFVPAAGGSATGITFDTNWSGTGSAADGGDLALTYALAGLGGRADERPIKFISCDVDATTDATYSRSSANLPLQTSAAWQSTTKPYTAAGGSLRQTYQTPTGDQSWFTGDWADLGTGGKWFIGYDFNTDTDFTGSNNKLVRCWTGSGATGGGALIVHHFGGIAALDIDGDSGTDIPSRSYEVPSPDSINTWYNYQWQFRESTSNGAADGHFQFWLNGAPALATSNVNNWVTRNAGDLNDGVKRYPNLYQASNQGTTGPPGGAQHFLHSAYITDTWFRFFISNESSISTTIPTAGQAARTNRRVMQLPKATGNSDSAASLKSRHGYYTGAAAGNFLWAVTATGTFIRVGTLT